MFSDTPLPAGLARRLAEAADGFRDGLYHYFIASSTYPYFLLIPQGSSSDDNAKNAALAELEKARLDFPNRNYEVYGPFLTEFDIPLLDYDTIEIRLLSTAQYQNPVVVRSFTVTSDTDAIFFTMSAYDKFAHPHYSRMHSPQTMMSIRSNTQQSMGSKIFAIHKSGTYLYAADGTPIYTDA
ncbi:hypothetical protein [Pollutibacter soli]|uniref:hypothetical protein n=1 Tax=Pollutibacter soli TaxID=3034157 RepID=UPI0030139AE9